MIFTECNENNQVLSFSGNNGGSYMHDALYESYIQAKIDAEDRLAFALKESMIISEADYSNIRALQEAKLGDKIKSKWKKFIAFIKGMVARFMESMTNLILNEKDYLEKYEKIICYKNPKNTIEYDSDYKVAINRLIGVEVPLFDYAKYKDALEANDKGELVKKIMSGKQGFSYDNGVELAELFKRYFLALDTKRTIIKAGDSSKIMEDMYNFCHGFEKMQSMVDKDINTLDNSTRRIEAMIKEHLDSNENKDDVVSKPDTKINDDGDNSNESGGAGTVVADKSSAIIYKNGFIINEKVKITEDDPSSNPISKMNSTNKEDTDAEKDLASNASDAAKGKTDKNIQDAANKWIEVCRIIIAAKLTACKQIAKDYMEIIRAHVRSYGGTDKKDTSNNISPTGGTKYTKAAAKAAIEAKKEENTT